MKGTKLSILGFSELKWTGRGHFQAESYKLFVLEHETMKKNDVASICNKIIAKSILGYNPILDRIISIRIQDYINQNTGLYQSEYRIISIRIQNYINQNTELYQSEYRIISIRIQNYINQNTGLYQSEYRIISIRIQNYINQNTG